MILLRCCAAAALLSAQDISPRAGEPAVVVSVLQCWPSSTTLVTLAWLQRARRFAFDGYFDSTSATVGGSTVQVRIYHPCTWHRTSTITPCFHDMRTHALVLSFMQASRAMQALLEVCERRGPAGMQPSRLQRSGARSGTARSHGAQHGTSGSVPGSH